MRRQYWRNRPKRLVQMRGYWRAKRLGALKKLGNQCVHCGEKDWRCLQVDHVEGGGTKENDKHGTYWIYNRIIGGQTEGYQVLCANCNWKKRYDKGEGYYA